MKTTKVELQKVEAFKIHYVSKYGNVRNKVFASLKTAANKIAWWMIFDKYDEFGAYAGTDDLGPVYTARNDPPLRCHCDSGDWSICELHDHKTGYYRRAHDKLEKVILRQLKQAQA